jgi:hypothetical protein
MADRHQIERQRLEFGIVTDYAKIKQRCAEDPEYRKQYLAMRARNNQAARDRAKAKLTPEEIEERRKRNEEKRIAAVRDANAKRKQPERRADLPVWKKSKPGRIVALCGWKGWG